MPTYDLGLEHVSLAFATKTVFTDVTQGVFEGDRIGIVGRNGDGKSTLLKLLDGTQEPDSGRVTRRNGLTFGMLTQRDALDDNATLREAALEGREDYEWASQQQSREIVEALLGGMNLDAKIGSLSGGQRRRADLARLLLKDWDILALDEPTNHLDVEARKLAIIGIKGQEMSEEEVSAVLEERKKNWKGFTSKYDRGLLKLYAQHAVSAMKGAYMD